MAAFETLINGMYVTMYNRTADSVGFNWASGVAGLPNPTDARNTVASTLSAQNIAQVFRSTQPTYFNAQYGSISTTDAILKLYQNLGGNTSGVDASAIQYWTEQLANVGGDLSKLAGQFTLEFLNYNGTDTAGLARQQSLNNRVAVSQSWVTESGRTANAFMNAQAVNDQAFLAQTAIISGVNASNFTLSQALSQITQTVNLGSVTSLLNIPRFLNVQQVVAGEAQGKPYVLNDSLKNIAANDAVRNGALSFQISNGPGTVGAATVHEATVLQSAGNKSEYTYSLTDSIGNIWPTSPSTALLSLITGADTVAIVGTDSTETLLLSGFPRSMIINGHGGDDRMIGASFNDVFYGGSGTNQYFGNGGSDTYNLESGAPDLVNLSKSSNRSFDGIQYIKNFGQEDKIVLRQDDVTADLQGSWTQDDFAEKSADLPFITNPGEYSLADLHGAAVVEFTTPIGVTQDLDGVVTGAKLLAGYGGRTVMNGLGVNSLVAQQGWSGFLVAYEQQTGSLKSKAFVYFASDTTGNASLTFDEIRLVAVVEQNPGWTSAATGWLEWTNFAL